MMPEVKMTYLEKMNSLDTGTYLSNNKSVIFNP